MILILSHVLECLMIINTKSEYENQYIFLPLILVGTGYEIIKYVLLLHELFLPILYVIDHIFYHFI